MEKFEVSKSFKSNQPLIERNHRINEGGGSDTG